MASIKFQVRGKRNPSKITIRLIIDEKNDFRKITPILINPDYFNNKSGKVRQVAGFTDKQNIQNKLDELSNFVIKKFNEASSSGEFINSGWLITHLDSFFNKVEVTDNNYLDNYCEHYVNKLKLKTNDRTGSLGASKATITKYKTIKKKIENFQKQTRKKYRLSDVDLKFRDEFLTYMLETDKLARNTAGRYLKFLKTICLDAQRSGYKVSNELSNFKGFKVPVKKIYLSFDELKKIEETNFKNKQLENAKDWLIIGCYIGQRAGDLLQLTNKNLKSNGNLNFIELVQQKTKKRVVIPVHPKVQKILEKYNGNFPDHYSKNRGSAMTVFNRLIKDVAKDAGLTQIIEGAKIDEHTNRKKDGKYPKHQLVTSHICRRSFATNYYGTEIPTAHLINTTGHSTEREFLNYIGKTSLDSAAQMASYWNKQIQREQEEEDPKLKAVK
ncbi:Site-specific recombinase XerD [Mesonia phycicola]|uniref:Site-specific recombinase XerD n=1 Tax=Mesonia phycicola TaxID=579105 RepID=A0A1M6DWN0_9FLAO|nr:phage integrase SAM-like domain-containing protein [Mesonia phycicola]SHI77602.1 Site-specific recombinase XerD [Mesonia phycicola]